MGNGTARTGKFPVNFKGGLVRTETYGGMELFIFGKADGETVKFLSVHGFNFHFKVNQPSRNARQSGFPVVHNHVFIGNFIPAQTV